MMHNGLTIIPGIKLLIMFSDISYAELPVQIRFTCSPNNLAKTCLTPEVETTSNLLE